MNAHSARILRELPKARTPAPDEITFDVPQRKLQDVLADRPTRSFSSAGRGRRSSVEPATDPIEEDTRRFLKEVVEFLERERKAGSFKRIVFIAPDKLIGLWRRNAPESLKDCVTQEYGKNLMGLSPEDRASAIQRLVTA